MLSSGTPSGYRTLGVLGVSLREEDEGQVGRRDQVCLSSVDPQLESLANIRGCVPGSRDVRGGKFGLRIRDSKPSDTGSRGHSDPMDVDAVNSLSSSKGKGSSPRDGS